METALHNIAATTLRLFQQVMPYDRQDSETRHAEQTERVLQHSIHGVVHDETLRKINEQYYAKNSDSPWLYVGLILYVNRRW